MTHFKSIVLASAVAVSGAITATDANALLIDFTDNGKWFTSAGQTTKTVSYTEFGGFDVTLESVGGDLTFTAFDGGDKSNLSYCNDAGGPLACNSDGAGVGDDEVTGAFITTGQSIEATFSKARTVKGFHFLDLFESVGGGDEERALIDYGSDGGIPDESVDAVAAFETDGGYRFFWG